MGSVWSEESGATGTDSRGEIIWGDFRQGGRLEMREVRKKGGG